MKRAVSLIALIGLTASAAELPADHHSEARPHWSLTPLTRPALPAPDTNPIDSFIRSRLAAKHLNASPEADRKTLGRRLSYDLTGLPPTPEELNAFVSNPDPRAYDALVNRLLSSPRHGEHWARHWLDVVNYADTHGNDHDYARPNAWPYRDYVIRSFNEDKPYPRFVQEQVAGDALFPEDPQATVALGFVAAGPWDHTLMVTVREDTVDHRMSQYLDRDNMVSTVMGTFQGLTVQCARCHNHKFEPISQRDYYSLQAVFAGVDRANRPFDADSRTHVERRRLMAEQRALRQRDPAVLARLESAEVRRTVAAWEMARQGHEEAWTPFDILSIASTGGATLTRQPDGSWLAGGHRPDRETYVITARRPAGKLGAIRLEALPDDGLPQHGPGRWDNGNFHLTEFRTFVAVDPQESARPLRFARATADHDEGPTVSASQAIDGKDNTSWGVHPRYGERHEAVFALKDAEAFPDLATFTILLEFHDGVPGHGLGRFRLSGRSEVPDSAAIAPLPSLVAALLRIPATNRSPVQRQELALAVLTAESQRALTALPAPQWVYAITDDFPPDGDNFKPAAQPRPIHLLARGQLDQPREVVGPGTLGCVPGMPRELVIGDGAHESARRAALARWLTDENNVLTWRSIVNRVWAWHFGRGICDTPGDLGKMGGTPSHPELLDWLAVWFRDEAHGSLKALHRLIVSSQTWKQTTLAVHGSAVDADNLLLWRQNRPRLTGEQVRDSLLALSGKADWTMGGPPAVQFISRGDATFMSGGNPAFLDYEHFDPDAPAARRRAIYRFVFRTVPDPFLDALDVPDGCLPTPTRTVSTTAVQAFAMWNDPFLIRQCEHIATRLKTAYDTPEKQAASAIHWLLLREAGASERNQLAGYIRKHGLANACQLLLNSNEFLYLD